MNKPIKTGIASFGMSGQVFHAPLLKAGNGYDLHAIVERNKNLSRDRYPETILYRSYKDLLNDPEIELVVVNTPDYLHFEQTKLAIEAGKHVIVEKPFTQKTEDALTLIDLAKKYGVILTVFQNRRWDSDFLTVRNIVESNRLGRLVFFESHFDRYRNYIQENTWKEELSSGAGIVYNLGSHLIDQVIVLFGKPVSVNAEIKTLRTKGKNDDFFNIRLEYHESLIVAVTGSLLVREGGPRYILHGTEGSYLKWGTDRQEQDLKEGKIPGTPGWGIEDQNNSNILNTVRKGEAFRGKTEPVPGNYPEFYNMLHDAIRKGAKVPVEPEDAALVIRIIEASFKSSAEGRRVIVS